MTNVLVSAGVVLFLQATCIAKGPRMGPPEARPDDRPPILHWNAWWEAGEPGNAPDFAPVPRLDPDSHVTLFLDLARLRYGAPNVASRTTGEEFQRRVQEWLERPSAPKHMTLRALVLADAGFFTVDDRVGRLVVERAKVNEPASTPREVDPLEVQAAIGSVARVPFALRTRERTGRTTVAISIWLDEIPVDELQIEVCVGGDAACAEPPRIASVSPLGLAGYDPAAGGAPPAAAIHLVELSPDKRLRGVLHRRGWPADRFSSWELSLTARELTTYLEKTIGPALNAASGGQGELATKSIALQRILFPPEPRAEEARAAFLELVNAHFANHTAASDEAPEAVFLRAVPYGDSAPLIFPIGLLGAKVGDTVEFLGLHFRFEQPLEVPSFGASPDCVRDWTLAIRGEGAELEAAWAAIEPAPSWGRARRFGDMPALRTWLGDAAGSYRGLLAVVSHHDHNQLWFKEGEELVSTEILRRFEDPSVAILDGCGTGTVSASHLIRTLNTRGVSAAIATQTLVKGRMAGEFLRCLEADGLPKGAESTTLGEAYFAAVRCLAKVEPAAKHPYGAGALTYTLLGNSAVRICRPEATP